MGLGKNTIDNTMGDQDMLGYAGQDMAAPGTAGGTTNPSTGSYMPPSAPVDTNSLAMVNNKSLQPLPQGSQVLNEMERKSSIPMNLTTQGQTS